MKAQPLRKIEKGYEPCKPEEATHLELHLPGPFPTRILPVMIGGTRRGTGNWTWNGSVESPTIKPSILTRLPWGDKPDIVCHSWVSDGKVQFLNDCTHSFAGKTVSLLDIY